MLSAEELHRRGVAAINAGRIGAARRLLVRARGLSGSDELTGAIEASLAYVEAETGDRQAAMLLLDTALARSRLSRETRGVLHSQRALLTMLKGETSQALHEFQAAIAVLRDYPVHLGRALLNRGNLYLQQGSIAEAEADFRDAVTQLSLGELPLEAAMSRHNLGYARYLAGDLVAALRDMDSAREVLAPLSSVSAAVGDQDRAEVFMAAGLRVEGRAALVAAASAYGSSRLRRRQAEAELALAKALLLEKPEAARTVAHTAVKRFEKAGVDAWAARARAVALAADVLRGRTSANRLREAWSLADVLEEQGLHWESVNVHLYAIRGARQREVDDPANGDELARVRLGKRAPLATRLLYRDVRAELATTAGRRTAALDHLRTGIAELHAWQSSFGSLDLQTNVVAHGVALAKRGLAIAVESRSDAVLFEWSERARMLASRVQPVRAPQDEQTVADLTELRAGPPPDREAELRQRIRERAWQTKGSGQVADPVTLVELQEKLDHETALAAYVVTADRVVGLVVTKDGAKRHDLGDRAPLDALLGGLLPDLDVASSELPGAMAVAVRTELADRLAELGKLLVEPLLDDLGDRKLVLTPSGVLAGVPWTLLPGLAGRPLTVAQSATSWLTRRATPLRADTAGLVAGPRVARAEAEVSAAAAAWSGAKTLTGEAATAGAVSELACEVDVLHLAAHGKHSSENPLFSGVQLVDGSWFGYDIDQLTAVPDIVILSACEVGRSSVRAGEELIGMTAAWLHAGARCVIASAASVSDDVAHDVLTQVHEQLAQGVAPDVALAEAVPAVDAERPPAPFVCFG